MQKRDTKHNVKVAGAKGAAAFILFGGCLAGVVLWLLIEAAIIGVIWWLSSLYDAPLLIKVAVGVIAWLVIHSLVGKAKT